MNDSKNTQNIIENLDTTNKILVDWFSFSTTAYTLAELLNFLGLNEVEFSDIVGVRGYTKRLYFDGININYAPSGLQFGKEKDINSIWVEMSGKGCRTFETFSKLGSCVALFSALYNNADFCVNRLDIAYDDFEKKIDLKSLSDFVLKEKFVSRFNPKSCTCKINAGYQGCTCYLGSMRSDVAFRCYDKAFERGYFDEIKQGFTWTRFEMQLRHERCNKFMGECLENNNIGDIFKGVLINYFRPVVPDENDSNKRRWKSPEWWNNFIGDVEKISLFTRCTADYNIEKCEDFVFHHCGNVISLLEQVNGKEKFWEMLNERKPQKMPMKYKVLLNDHDSYAKIEEADKIRQLKVLAKDIYMINTFNERFAEFKGDNLYCSPELYQAVEKLSLDTYIKTSINFDSVFTSLSSGKRSEYSTLLSDFNVVYDKNAVYESMLKTFLSQIFVTENYFIDPVKNVFIWETGSILELIGENCAHE